MFLLAILFLTFFAGQAFADSLSDIASNAMPEDVRDAFADPKDVNKIYPGGETPLMFAAANNPNFNVIHTLVALGADVNASDDVGLTPLMFAVTTNKSLGIAYSLITLGADVLAADKSGTSVLMYAARDATPELVETILSKNTNVNAKTADGWTPVMFAAAANPNLRVVELLLEAGADVNVRNADGITPLMLAAQFTRNPEILELILRHSANVQESSNGKRALDFAMSNKNLTGSQALRNLERTTKSEF